jgi:hypothetical protein
VLELAGSPEEMGRAHGELLRDDVRRVVRDVLAPDDMPERYSRIIAGARVMERSQPERFRREMRALASASGVDYMRIVALQLFGDVELAGSFHMDLPEVTDVQPDEETYDEPDARDTRGPDGAEREPAARPAGYRCTNFATFGRATATGECIAGRNFDYWYQDVAEYASIIAHYRPPGRRSFVTLSWAGVINGWTLMNEGRVCTANNLAYGEETSLEAVSTCFLLRVIAEEAGSVEEGIAIARGASRAVGTAMLVAGGEPPDAVELEFDHATFVVRRAHRGFVIADNSSRALGRETPLGPEESATGRYGRLLELILANHGRIDRTMNFAAAPGVALEGINLHSAMLFPRDLTFACSMGEVPASRGRFRRFRMTPRGIVSAE